MQAVQSESLVVCVILGDIFAQHMLAVSLLKEHGRLETGAFPIIFAVESAYTVSYCFQGKRHLNYKHSCLTPLPRP